jgi:cell filamentation protein
MQKNTRYDTANSDEGEFESGSNELVLRNLKNIHDLVEIERYETELLAALTHQLIQTFESQHRFTAKDICGFHKAWLGNLYSWAGNYRQVNLSKGGFSFAAAHLIPKLMTDFEKRELAIYTPCNFQNSDEVLYAIAIVHVELILIHPFREGNGRLTRLLTMLMGLQSELFTFDFSEIKGRLQEEYFAAVRAGFDRNYQPMIDVLKKILVELR